MAQGQPRLQSPFIPGQKEPADLALEQEISQQPQTKKPGSFMRFFSRNTESSGNGGSKGAGPVEGDDKQQGDYYAPVPTKFGAKKGSDENPSSQLDGPREGAEMSDLYSPQSAVESTVTQSNPSFEIVESSPNITENTPADTDEHEQRGESAGTIISAQGLVEASKGMATEASETLVQIRGRVMEKLSSLHLPSESLEAVRKTFETGLKGAYTTTVDAVQRTKQSLLDILPASLAHTNANEARRVVEDMEHDLLQNSEGSGEDQSQVVPESSEANFARPVSDSAAPRLSKL